MKTETILVIALLGIGGAIAYKFASAAPAKKTAGAGTSFGLNFGFERFGA